MLSEKLETKEAGGKKEREVYCFLATLSKNSFCRKEGKGIKSVLFLLFLQDFTYFYYLPLFKYLF